jgi:hypothetical protein
MELWIALIGTATAVVTITLTNFFAKKNELNLKERKLKEEYYISFIKAISESVVSHFTDKSMDNLSDIQNKLLLVASSEVINRLMIFNDYIKVYGPRPEFSEDKHDELLTELIKAMRKDLFLNQKINNDYPIIHLTNRKNPHRGDNKWKN